jgi:replicative DNA helicase
MTKEIKGDLGFLGVDYQYMLVKVFIEDKPFFRDLNSIVDQNMFTEPNLRYIVGLMKDYFADNESTPSYELIAVKIRAKSKNKLDTEIHLEILKKIKLMSSEGQDEVKRLADKFFKQQNIVKTANQILKIAGDGDVSKYEKCVDLINNAINVGSHDEFSYRLFDDYEETLSEDFRYPIPTGISKIDEVLEGGIGKGELGVIIGPSSFGKTSLTTAMSNYAATFKTQMNDNNGFKVMQITFEDSPRQIRRKHFGRISGVESCNLSKSEYLDEVQEKTSISRDENKMLQNNVLGVRFPSGEKTATDIKNYIKRKINEGFKPDLIIIDYFECLSVENSGSDNDKWAGEGKAMRKLESMANEFQVALWVTTQGTKESLNSEIVTLDKAGGSFKKIQIAHIVMSIARTIEDIEHCEATIAILKNRAGKSGKVFNGVYFDNGTCTISTDNVQEFSNIIGFREDKQKELLNMQKEVFKSSIKKTTD